MEDDGQLLTLFPCQTLLNVRLRWYSIKTALAPRLPCVVAMTVAWMLRVCLAPFAPCFAGGHRVTGSNTDVRLLASMTESVLRHKTDEWTLAAGVWLLAVDLYSY